MVWFFVALGLIFLHSEILYGFLRISRLMPTAHEGKESVAAEVLTRRSLKVYIVDSLPIDVLSLLCFWRPRILIHRAIWDQLNSNQREILVVWLALAAKFENAGLRLLRGPSLIRLDRDLCILANQSLEWASVLKLLYEWRASHPPSSLGAVLAGLSALGPGIFQETLEPGYRLKALAEQLTKFRK